MVHSLVLAIATDSECLMCGDFSLSETIHFGSLEFIADCFGGLRLSPKGSDSGIIFMGEGGQRPTFIRASQTVTSVPVPMNPLPPSSADRVDRLYRQLVEIHTIVMAQLAECTY
jgi:hypothetical protein